MILKDLEECEDQVMALRALVPSSDSNNTQLQKLYSDLTQLHTTVVVSEEDPTVAVIFSMITSVREIVKVLTHGERICQANNSPNFKTY